MQVKVMFTGSFTLDLNDYDDEIKETFDKPVADLTNDQLLEFIQNGLDENLFEVDAGDLDDIKVETAR